MRLLQTQENPAAVQRPSQCFRRTPYVGATTLRQSRVILKRSVARELRQDRVDQSFAPKPLLAWSNPCIRVTLRRQRVYSCPPSVIGGSKRATTDSFAFRKATTDRSLSRKCRAASGTTIDASDTFKAERIIAAKCPPHHLHSSSRFGE